MKHPCAYIVHPTPLSAVLLLVSTGCAGPNTPLGAVSWVSPELAEAAVAEEATSSTELREAASPYAPRVSFRPDRQVLHTSTPLEIVVRDPFGSVENYDLTVLYDGLDVSGRFLASADVQEDMDHEEIRIRVPKVRLDPTRDHSIELLYRSRSGSQVHVRYEAPTCLAFQAEEVRQTGSFRPSARLMQTINRQSLQAGFNPAFLTGLIAQESGFQTRSVSWARAIGLTQITPIAEKEVIQEYPRWPRYPRLNRFPAPVQKAMIVAGRVRASNEWRLDP
ncbi:MAG TPA: lytic transglycosylase domain-containing protein, partial [Bdellovibrionota bacterium]|nr:lytic transglycosylase domain-containing protein [Bdellovibrionota bacterium]